MFFWNDDANDWLCVRYKVQRYYKTTIMWDREELYVELGEGDTPPDLNS